MAQLKRNRLDGLNPLSYLGVAELSPSDQVFYNRPPNASDNKNFYVGTWWIDTGTNAPNPPAAHDVWLLVSLDSGVATWIHFGSGDLQTLTGNDGIAVGPDINGNIDFLGAGGLQVTNTAPNTLTVAPINGNVASQFETDDLLITNPDATGLLNVRSAIAVGGIADNLFSRQGVAPNTITYELNPSIIQPNTNASGTEGLYTLGTTDFVSNYAGAGAGGNAFFGGAGNRTLTTAAANTGVGFQALLSLTTSTNNTAVGVAALQLVTSSLSNIAIGNAAGSKISTGSGRNIAVGVQALLNATTASNNVAVGTGAMATDVTGTDNCAFGDLALSASTVSQLNAFGSGALQTNSTGTNNCAFGYHSQHVVSTAVNNCSFGNLTLAALTTGGVSGTGGNSAFGHGALAVTTGSSNCAFGFGSGSLNTAGFENCAFGVGALGSNLTGARNVAIGHLALNAYNGADNVAVGWRAGVSMVTGATTNTAVGTQALEANDTGDSNTVVGYRSGQALNGVATGNTAIGDTSLNECTTGTFNTALGHEALQHLVTGTHNIAVGQVAGDLYTGAETANILIGNRGTVGDNNTIRIGTPGGSTPQNACFIHGIRGVTTGVNDAIAVLIDSAGQLGTISSSLRYKENVRPLEIDSKAIYKLNPVSFNYKQKLFNSIGLIAEEVEQVLPELVVKDDLGLPETVKYQDLPILLLAEIKKLKHRIDELERNIK